MIKTKFIAICMILIVLCMCAEEGTETPSPTTTIAPTTPASTTQPPTTTPSEHIYYSQLDITSVTSDNNKITIKGTTDLPPKSSLIVGIEIAGLKPDDKFVGANTSAQVSDGKFSAIMDAPTNPAFAKGPYVASALFTPKGQEQSVLNCVGVNGEYLAGEHLRSENWNMLEVEVTIDSLNFNIRTEYPMVNVTDYPFHSAERALAEFLISWQDEDWERMASFTQKTWRYREDNPADMMWAWFGFMELQGAEINNIVRISETTIDISFTIYYLIGNNIKSETKVARVICETGPYTPDTSGEWGVNPISVL